MSEIITPDNLDSDRTAIFEALSAVPDYQSYQGSEAVAAGFAGLCAEHAGSSTVNVRLETVRPDGESGESLNALVVELPDTDVLDGYSTAFLMGNVHSNELMWTRTFDFLPRLLSERPDLMRQLQVRSVIFLDAAPQTTSLNGDRLLHGHGDLTVEDYYKSAFRSHQQPDWDLTVDYADFSQRPADGKETAQERIHRSSLIGARVTEILLRQYQPELVHTLHNAAVDGTFIHASRVVGSLDEDLEKLRNAVRPALPLGGAETTGLEPFATNMYPVFGAREDYLRGDAEKTDFFGDRPGRYLEQLVGAAAFGSRHLDINNETPYFSTAALADHTLSGATMRQVRQELEPLTRTMLQQMAKILNATAVKTDLTPQEKMMYEATDLLHTVWVKDVAALEEDSAKRLDTELTVAERAVFFSLYTSYLAVFFGQAARLAEQTGDTLKAEKAYQTLHEAAGLAETYLQPRFVPRRIQVAMHAGTTLLSLLALRDERLARI